VTILVWKGQNLKSITYFVPPLFVHLYLRSKPFIPNFGY